MSFATALKTYRSTHDLTQKQLAELLSCDPTFSSLTKLTYYRWESGKTTPSPKKQAKVWLLLNEKQQLRALCEANTLGFPSLQKALRERWDRRRYGVDNFYDDATKDTITFSEVDCLEKVPDKAIKAHMFIYPLVDAQFNVGVDNYKQLIDASSYNFIQLASCKEDLAGQMAFQVVTVDVLNSYLHKLEQNPVNSIESLGLTSDQEIIFLSSFHSTRKKIYLEFIHTFIEQTLQLKQIPSYVYLRVYGDITTKLIDTLLEPRLINTGASDLDRVKHGNQFFDWLGYAVPTHLFILHYGALLTAIEQEEETV